MKHLSILALVLTNCVCCSAWQELPILDEDVKPLYFETLAYPVMARISRIQGVVVIRVMLSDDGTVVSARPISGPKELIPECLANSKKWRFEPTPDKMAVIIYEFRIDGLCQLPCASQFTFRPPNSARITTGEAVVDHAGDAGKKERDRGK